MELDVMSLNKAIVVEMIHYRVIQLYPLGIRNFSFKKPNSGKNI